MTTPTNKMVALRALLERVEVAEEGSPGLDIDIGRGLRLDGSASWGWWTRKVDDAIALAAMIWPAPQHGLSVRRPPDLAKYRASILGRGQVLMGSGTGATPALAIVAAVLRAVIAREETDA